ncbi:hypothetical protein TNCV_531461 [Trichonephila clavipes]|nr:hypothetical protein TNCV_531461 [Trichonephila clavipes]
MMDLMSCLRTVRPASRNPFDNLTSQQYRYEILHGAYVPNFLFMDDYALLDRAQLVGKGILLVWWPVMSFALNTHGPSSDSQLQLQQAMPCAGVDAVAPGVDKDAGKQYETLMCSFRGDHTPY